MKRLFLISMFILSSICSLFAIMSAEEMVVTFDILDQGYVGYLDFGFANDSNARKRLEDVSVDVTKTEEEQEDVYAYWNTLSTLSFVLEMYAEPLVADSGAMLDWTISWDSDEKKEKTYIGGSKYGEMNSETLYTRVTSSGSTLSDYGNKKLDIDIPVDESVMAGSYTGHIVMTLESIE